MIYDTPVRQFFDNNKGLIALVIDFARLDSHHFFTPASAEFQLGFGCVDKGYSFDPHIHKTAPRSISNTSEFIYVLSGRLSIQLYDVMENKLDNIRVAPGCAVLQFFGGHAISADKNTRYFEIKQGPYVNKDFDKYLI
jgi:hypothetical protein